MASVIELFWLVVARGANWSHLSDRAQSRPGRAPPRLKSGEANLPALFRHSPHMRRDIGLAPVDDNGWPL
jgi:hypothetical protein